MRVLLGLINTVVGALLWIISISASLQVEHAQTRVALLSLIVIVILQRLTLVFKE